MVATAIRDCDHPQAGPGALVATDDDAAAIGDGAVDLGEGDCASGIAHGDNGEEGVRCQSGNDVGRSSAGWEVGEVKGTGVG